MIPKKILIRKKKHFCNARLFEQPNKPTECLKDASNPIGDEDDGFQYLCTYCHDKYKNKDALWNGFFDDGTVATQITHKE